MAGSSGRRRPLIVIGVLLIVVGLVAGAALWIGATDRRNDAIADLARAPVGCDTTLDFVEGGEYLVFIESEGELDEVRGDCGATGEYDISAARAAAADIAVVDPDGQAVDLDPVDGSEVSYDENGFVGSAAFRLEVADAADHVIRVESTDDAFFAVAIGRDPSDGVTALRAGGVIAALVGLLIGIALIVLGMRRRVPTSSGATGWAPAPSPWQPGVPAPQQPPMGPPVHAQPQGPPRYGPSSAPPRPQAPPPPPAPGGSPQWQPPPPPGAPRIPGEPDLNPAPPPPPSMDDADATTQERPTHPTKQDRPPLPPPE